MELPQEFDPLSIDIDGNDYQVWNSLEEYEPRVVIMETNNRFSPEEYRINDPGRPFVLGESGSSSAALNDLTITKGYALTGMIGCNVSFVIADYWCYFHDEVLTPSDVFTYEGSPKNERSLRQKWRKVEIRVLRELARRI